MQTAMRSATAAGSRPRAGTVLAIAVAFSLGTLLLWGAGFANSQTLHDAAHDGRHSFAFPCH